MNDSFPAAARRLATVLILGLGALGVLPGCASSQKVRVDAVRRAEADEKDAVSYRIVSGNRELDETTLEFKNAAGLVKNALAAKGMYEAPVPEKADMVVAIDYGVSDPKVTHETRSRPVYRMIELPPERMLVAVGKTPAGQVIYQEVIVPGRRERIYDGEEYYQVVEVKYEKHLQIAARANGTSDDTSNSLWSVSATSTGDRPDLRKSLPVLAAASINVIGSDTRGEKTIKVREDDGAVEFVQQDLGF